jgi:hypothetical protein
MSKKGLIKELTKEAVGLSSSLLTCSSPQEVEAILNNHIYFKNADRLS